MVWWYYLVLYKIWFYFQQSLGWGYTSQHSLGLSRLNWILIFVHVSLLPFIPHFFVVTPSDIQHIVWDFYLIPCYWWPLKSVFCSWAPRDYLIFNVGLSTHFFIPITGIWYLWYTAGNSWCCYQLARCWVELANATREKAIPSVRITTLFPLCKDLDISVFIALVAVQQHEHFFHSLYCFYWENSSVLSWSAKNTKTVYHLLVEDFKPIDLCDVIWLLF